jgi:hypothetical protein
VTVDRALASRLLRHELATDYEVTEVLGNAVVASGGGGPVVLKHRQPSAALVRLAELGVTPPVLATGEFEGVPYTIQQMIRGEEPDRAWFARHVADLADLIFRYQRDPALAAILSEDRSRERLTVRVAAMMFDDMPPRAGSRFWTEEMIVARAEWRRQADRFQELTPVPVHTDPMWGNYVVDGDRMYLLDWDDIDLSDPWRDIGVQLHWHVPVDRWPYFVDRFGARLDDELLARIHWWMAFKELRTGFWVDARGIDHYAMLCARGFLNTMAGRCPE